MVQTSAQRSQARLVALHGERTAGLAKLRRSGDALGDLWTSSRNRPASKEAVPVLERAARASAIWELRLAPHEAAAMAIAALRATEPALAHIVATEVIGGAGVTADVFADHLRAAGLREG